jgi:hypothetical protein
MKLIAIRDKLQSCFEHPPCCLTIDKNNRMSCDTLGPMPEKAFLLHCKECREKMEEQLARIEEIDA